MRDNIIVRYLKKTSNLNKVLFVFLFVFLLVGNVKAENKLNKDVIANSDGSYKTENDAKTAAEHKGSSLTDNDDGFIVGLRVSILKSDGTEIFSNDYVDHSFGKDYYVTYTNSPNSKVNAVNVPSLGSWYKKSIDSISELQEKFTNSGINININNLLKSKKLTKDFLFPDMIKNKDTEQAKKFFKQFIGENIEEYYNSEKQAYDLFFVWEPLAKFNYKNWYTWNGALKDISRDVYLGTIYELSMALNYNDNVGYIEANKICDGNENGCILVEENEACFINGGECDDPEEGKFKYTLKPYTGLSGFLRQLTINMACSTYLEDSDDWGNLVSQKFGENFSARDFFNNRLSSNDANNIKNGCDSGNPWGSLQTSALNSTSSLGIGILWFDDIANANQVTCYDVEKVYEKTNLWNSIISGTANFDEFNKNWFNIHGSMPTNLLGGVTAEWYKQYCMKDDPKPEPGQPLKYNCTPKYELSNCEPNGIKYQDVNEDGYINAEYWQNCIFNDNGRYDGLEENEHKYSNKTKTLTYYDSNLSSDYCDVYCIEGVYVNFDSRTPTVLAGSNFTWGDYSTVIITRTCSTKSIDIESFKNDLNTANKVVANELAQNQLYNQSQSKYWEYIEEDEDCKAYPISNLSECAGVDDTLSSDMKYCTTCTKTGKNKYKWSSDSALLNINGIMGSANNDDIYETDYSTPTHNPISKGNVEDAVKNVNKIISEFNKCYNFESNNILNDQSSATIYYESPNGKYTYNGKMEESRTSDVTQENCSTVESFTALKNCSGTDCSETTTVVYNCNMHDATKRSYTNFSLPDGIFQYVLKNNNLSIHQWQLTNYQDNLRFTNNYIDVGFSNFPVPFNSKDGTYEDELKIEYSNLGHYVSGKSETAVDSILKSIGTKQNINYGTWSCDYTVKSELIPDCQGDYCNPNPSCVGDNCNNSSKAGDINVIYREIDLEHPFPDTDANNRYTGANWCDNRDCKWNNSISNKVILNNRGSNGSEIYNKVPMYTFIMTPSDIIQIRRYNDENKYTSYTGSYGGKNYDFKCSEGKGNSCISEYLTELMTMMGTSDNPGTCKNGRETDMYDFDSCRYWTNQ